MGSHFTFELTLQKDHKLVTSGPYRIVRHPSYIGIYAFYLGSDLVYLVPGDQWATWAQSTPYKLVPFIY